MTIMDVRSRYPITLAWPRLTMLASRVNAIAIHHSVTPTPAANWTTSQELAVLDSIHRHHVAKGFGGIGYHLCCFPSGRWYYVCSLGQWGANVGGRNSELYGVCIIGTYTEIMPIDAALRSGALSVDLIDRYLKRKVATRPHGLPAGWTATTCPGVIRNKAATIRSYLPAPPSPTPDPIPAPPTPDPIPPPLIEEEAEMAKLSFIRVKGTPTVYLVEADRLIHAVNATHWRLTRGEEYDLIDVEPNDGILDMPTTYPAGVPAKVRK